MRKTDTGKKVNKTERRGPGKRRLKGQGQNKNWNESRGRDGIGAGARTGAGGGGRRRRRGFRSAEVAAFFGMMNYFRQEIRVRNAADTEWRNWHWYAGDRIVQDALDGKRTIGLRASLTTSFIGFDIDVAGKIEEASAGNEGSEGWREEEGGAGDGGDGDGEREGCWARAGSWGWRGWRGR